ncbi:MAG: 4-vinyl reductase, partial [Anaerolineales bacterium]|nr:4-vinyl reductase [Anaerolineales bacterium]
KIGVPAVARIFTPFSDQTTRVEDYGDHLLFYIDRCAMSGMRTSERPICYIAIGILQESLRWVSGGLEFRIEEIECIAMGAKSCVFKIDKAPIK